MDRQFASTELLALENNALAIERAIDVLKTRLRDAPSEVANDVLSRCDPSTHTDLIAWIEESCAPSKGRLPRSWSPKRSTRTWLLYHAANLECPPTPPGV